MSHLRIGARIGFVVLVLSCGRERQPAPTPMPPPAPMPAPRPSPGGSADKAALAPCEWVGANGIRAIAAFPGGGSFAVGYASGTIAIVSADSGKRIATIEAHLTPIVRLAVSSDGKTLASLGEEGRLRLWDAATGELRHEVKGTTFHNLAMSPDGATVIGAGAILMPVRVADGKEEWVITSHETGTAVLFVSPDGQSFTVGTDKLVSYALGDGTLLGEMSVSPFGIRAVSPDRTRLLGFRARTSSIALLNAQDGSVVWERTATGGSVVEDAAFTPDAASVVIALRNGPVTVVRASDGVATLTLDRQARAVGYSTDGRTIAVGLENGAFNLWDAASGQRRVKQAGSQGHREHVVQVAVSPDGALIGSQAYGSRDETLKVWRVSDRGLVFSTMDPPVRDGIPEVFAFSPDSSLIARTGEYDRRIELRAVGSGLILRRIDLRPGAPDTERDDATSIAFSPDGETLAVTGGFIAAERGVVRTFRVADGQPQAPFRHPEHDFAQALAFSPGGEWLAVNTVKLTSGPSSNALALYRAGDRTLVWTSSLWPGSPLGTPRGAPTFSRDGKLVATPDAPDRVRVFRTADGAPVTELSYDPASSAAFSPTDDLLAVTSAFDLRVHRTETGEIQTEIPGSFGSVAFAPDGRSLVAGGLDGSLHLFCFPAAPAP